MDANTAAPLHRCEPYTVPPAGFLRPLFCAPWDFRFLWHTLEAARVVPVGLTTGAAPKDALAALEASGAVHVVEEDGPKRMAGPEEVAFVATVAGGETVAGCLSLDWTLGRLELRASSAALVEVMADPREDIVADITGGKLQRRAPAAVRTHVAAVPSAAPAGDWQARWTALRTQS